MGRLQAHCSPLQAPPLEYQCSSSGNSSRTAIREKNNSIVLQEDKRATADLCRMTVTTQRARQFTASTKHNYIVFTGRHVPHIMTCRCFQVYLRLLKENLGIWIYCSKTRDSVKILQYK